MATIGKKPQEGPGISIVVPSFNQAKFIECCLESIVSQDYSQIECLVYDGGSQDDTVDIIKKYENELAHWQSKPDGGQASAINKGWRKSSGEILGWLNSDDYLLPGALSAVSKCAQNHPDAAVIVGQCRSENEFGDLIEIRQTDDYTYKHLLYGKSLPQPSVFIRRQVLSSAGFLNANLHFALDWAYFLKVMWIFQDRIVYIPDILSVTRMYKDTKSSTGLARKGDERRAVLETYFETNEIPANSCERRKALAGTYWVQGTDEFFAGKYFDSAISGLNALWNDPCSGFEKMTKLGWLVKSKFSRNYG